ncbi:siderophore-interacting protein [Nonomuraea endophytica]|uniref:NADPH-dependent ferric siderophore reductase n=1 Tax=Nonomuraea endophytica TaxID=714136 RepID=A0A7W8EDW4_9ACTN|nr:siderophore-interacting protein [Nonomuraea endophytica]MBB5075969.1 NADPH-dependent ferric siderophore reductase [Nonomuraea endophytica]
MRKYFARYTVEATVTDNELVTPTMRRIRLVANAPIGLPYRPGQHVRVQINDPLSVPGILRPGETLRTYTIWELDGRAIELRVHDYPGDGIGLVWARETRPGAAVTLWWPQGDLFTREAPFHVFVGEESASAAFGPMIRELGPTAQVYGVLESESAEHDLPMPGEHPLRRVHRRGAPAVSSTVLLAGLAELELPGNTGAAYVAGEAKTCQMVRDYLVRERNWPRTSIKVKPFWAPGKKGLH